MSTPAAPRKKRQLTRWQRIAFSAPMSAPRNTERVIPKNARMGVKANDN